MAHYLYKKLQTGTENRLEANERLPCPNRNERTVATNGLDRSNGIDQAALAHNHVGKEVKNGAANEEAGRTEAKAMGAYRWRIIVALLLPVVVQSLSTTTVAAAVPFIGSDFHQLSQLNWIISAYNLTSAAFIPAWGQFADVFGRYGTIQAAIVAMIIGSALCASAPVSAFPMLLAGRGLEGVGSAGILISAKTILADKASLKENAINNTIFSFIIGIGYGVGPVIGGYLTSVSWTWIFILNLPLCVAGLVLMHFITLPILLGPRDTSGVNKDEKLSSFAAFAKRLLTIDFGGQLLFLFGVGLIILGLTWAGSYYPWSSANVLVSLIVGVVLMIASFAWEFMLLPGRLFARRYPYQQAMLSLKLLWTINSGILMYINFVTGMAMYAVFYFADLYFTIVQQFDPGKSGTNLLYYIPS